jgi:hypothetical protein
MRPLSDRELVAVWEAGRGRPAWYRALLPLAAVLGTPVGDLAGWPLGRRDGWLLALRAWTFGPTLEAVSRCPAPGCGQAVEAEIAVPALLDAWPADDVPAHGEVEADGWALTLRPPSSRDFAAAGPGGPSPDDLLRRCVVQARGPGGAAAADDLPAALLREAESVLQAIDPLAAIEIGLTCPACGAAWVEPLNVAEYVWSEIVTAARALLLDVHALASAYGWTEGEILGLGPERRAAYRDLIDARPRSRRPSPQRG